MLEAIRRAMSFLRQKQILHKVGVVVSVTVIGIACYVLYHMLRGIDANEVIEAIKGTELHQIVLAALFVGAGYFTLTFYDLFAVRAIGRKEVPYRVNALAAFSSYSIGHNVGASVRSEEHTSELQSHSDLVCRLLLEKKKNNIT